MTPRLSSLSPSPSFYFLFVAKFSAHCIPLGFIGIVIGGLTLLYSTNRFKRQLMNVIFAPIIVLFMAYFLADFKRAQSIKAKEWGCYAWSNSKPRIRPAFIGVPQTDPVDGHIVIDWPSALRSCTAQRGAPSSPFARRTSWPIRPLRSGRAVRPWRRTRRSGCIVPICDAARARAAREKSGSARGPK